MKKILIAGPCVGEHSAQWIVDQAGAIAEQVKPFEDRYEWIFKTSFDKANRTERDSYRGLGIDQTLEAFVEIKKRFGCRVTTDIHETGQEWDLDDVVDVIQIPAMLSRQTDLIEAACVPDLHNVEVNIKVGTNMRVEAAAAAVDKAAAHGKSAWLTYRGTAFGDELVFDPNKLWRLAGHCRTLIADVTHSAATAAHVGAARLVNARVAAALGVVDGLFLECHSDPATALSDSGTQFRIGALGRFLEGLEWAM